MVRLIPVFAFAFAAYAATAAARRESAAEGDAGDLFLTTWRLSARQRANLRVKVRLGGQDIWLSDIAATARGFSGVPERLPDAPVAFALSHILAWRLDIAAASRREAGAHLELI